MAVLMKYILRPNHAMRRAIFNMTQVVFPEGVPRPLISLFVRRGDKSSEGTLSDFESYFNAIDTATTHLQQRLGALYVGTDSQEALDWIIAHQSSRYRIFYIPFQRSLRGAQWDDLKSFFFKPLIVHHTLMALLDLFLSMHGDIFVGTLSSNWCRMYDELRKANGKARIPFLTPEHHLYCDY
jgi:hypothetical protein